MELVRRLEKDYQVKLIAGARVRADFVAQQLNQALALVGDATRKMPKEDGIEKGLICIFTAVEVRAYLHPHRRKILLANGKELTFEVSFFDLKPTRPIHAAS